MKDNSTTLFRILSITQKLLEGRIVSKQELADEFKVSAKTIQRDINKRLSMLPIVLEKGTGWKLDKNSTDKNLAQNYSQIIQLNNASSFIELAIIKAREAIDAADAIIIASGAGMGVDSGLPDFRGDDGFWKAYPPLKALGISFHQMANPKWFVENPSMAWGFYGHRLNLYRNTIPHKGFNILKELVKLKENNYFIFTSNVDGQFQKAGFDSDKIEECHGSIHHNQCVSNCTDNIWSNEDEHCEVDLNRFLLTSDIPKCKYCNQIARPNILMFGDWGFNAKRRNTQTNNLMRWLQNNIANKKSKIVIIEIGAGKDIPTVRNFCNDISLQYKAKLIRINPRDYNGLQNTISIPLGGLEALEKIYN